MAVRALIAPLDVAQPLTHLDYPAATGMRVDGMWVWVYNVTGDTVAVLSAYQVVAIELTEEVPPHD